MLNRRNLLKLFGLGGIGAGIGEYDVAKQFLQTPPDKPSIPLSFPDIQSSIIPGSGRYDMISGIVIGACSGTWRKNNG